MKRKEKKNKAKLRELRIDKKETAHGIVFGKLGKKVVYSPTDAEGCVFVGAGTGCGKTASLGIPTLRAWSGTSFTIDISGDICRNSNMPDKMIFEPEDPNTVPYSIFAVIDDLDNVDAQNEALEQLAFLLMPESVNMNDNAKFFQSNGRKILTAENQSQPFNITYFAKMIKHSKNSTTKSITFTELSFLKKLLNII